MLFNKSSRIGSQSSNPIIFERNTLTKSLHREHMDISFHTNIELVRRVEDIRARIESTYYDGNQYIVVRDLPQDMVDSLSGGDGLVLGGRVFQFMFRGNTGVIRAPTLTWCRTITMRVASSISRSMEKIGIPPIECKIPDDDDLIWYPKKDCGWSSMACFKTKVPTLTGEIEEGKTADYSFVPHRRFQRYEETGQTAWPTIVIESGLCASLSRLREDAKWWLSRSQGEVRVVLVVTLYPGFRSLCVERWQLEHPPRWRFFRKRHKEGPPTYRIPPDIQKPCLVQKTIIRRSSIEGEDMVFPFEAIFDKSAKGRGNIVLSKKHCKSIQKSIKQEESTKEAELINEEESEEDDEDDEDDEGLWDGL